MTFAHRATRTCGCEEDYEPQSAEGPDPRTTSGPAVVVPRKQAGHMTCTGPPAERQILLAMRASSTHDPQQTSDLFCA